MKRIVVFKAIFLNLTMLPSHLHGDVKIHNHASSFVSYWNKSKNLSIQEKSALFHKEIVPLFPQFYNFRMKSWKNTEDNIGSLLESFSSIEDEFQKEGSDFPEKIKSALPLFKALFPDFDDDIELYIIHSLQTMAGGTRLINNKTYFIFGIENMIKAFPGDKIVLFHHELFHFYHTQRGFIESDDDMFYQNLWAEGMASYVSHILNPKASFVEIFGSSTENLAENFEKKQAYLLNEVIANLESKDKKLYFNYFYVDEGHPEIPELSGYYLGYILAKELHKTHTIEQLVSLKGSELLSKIRQTLREFSGGKDSPLF